MKKYILLAAMSLLYTSSFANKVQTGVWFGSKSNGVCLEKSGICQVKTNTSSMEAVQAYFELNGEGTELTMSIADADASMIPVVMYDDFVNGTFYMNDAYAMPAEVVTALQGMSDITLQKGTYSVVHTGGAYVVTFHL